MPPKSRDGVRRQAQTNRADQQKQTEPSDASISALFAHAMWAAVAHDVDVTRRARSDELRRAILTGDDANVAKVIAPTSACMGVKCEGLPCTSAPVNNRPNGSLLCNSVYASQCITACACMQPSGSGFCHQSHLLVLLTKGCIRIRMQFCMAQAPNYNPHPTLCDSLWAAGTTEARWTS